MGVQQGYLMIYRSPTGRDNWQPVLPDDVPEWVKDQDILGRLVAGEIACDPTEGNSGRDWYRAERTYPGEAVAQ